MAMTIQSLERGLLILDVLGKTGEAMSLNDIASHFSIDRSSVFRLITTLQKCGYVIQHRQTKQYSLGYKVLELSGALSNNSSIESIVRPIMRHILAQTNQNTHLAVLDGCDVVFLAVEQPKDHLAFNITVGSREPSAVTALGKSLLAFLPADERDLLFSQLKFKKYTDKSVTSKKQLQLHLKKIQTNLLAIDDEEYRPGVVCLAAPVFDHTRRVRYSIGISGLREVIKPNHEKFAGIVRQAGIDASNLLGYR